MIRKKLMKSYFFSPSYFNNSTVLYTLTFDCFLSLFSSDQIGQLSFNANAKYSVSSGSGEIAAPSFIHSDSAFRENAFNCILIAANSISKSFSERPLFFDNFFQCFPISNKSLSGELDDIFSEKKSLCLDPFAISMDIRILASTTSSIYTNPAFLSSLNLPFFIFLPSSKANLSAPFSDSLLFEEIASTRIRRISADLESCSSNNLDSIILFSKSSQSTSGNSAILHFNSSATSPFKSILASQKYPSGSNYLNFSYKIGNSSLVLTISASGAKGAMVQWEQSSLLNKDGNVSIGTTGPQNRLEGVGE